MYFYSLKSFLFCLEYRKSIFFFLAYISRLEVKTSKVAQHGQQASKGVGEREEGKRGGGWGLPGTFFILTVFAGKMTLQD